MFDDQCDDIGWHVEDVYGDQDRFALAWAAVAVGFPVRFAFDLDESHGLIEASFDCRRPGESYCDIANDARTACIVG